jgi:membrane protease subunit HflC
VAVDQREWAVVSLFGKIHSVIEEPGLAFTFPFATVTRVSRQLQEYATNEPSETVTGDKKNILISYFARYRVRDPVQFLQTIGQTTGGHGTMGGILYSELKTEVSKHSLEDIIAGRDILGQTMLRSAGPKLHPYGVDLEDFRIKRTDLPNNVIGSVYSRMRAERDQMAQTCRSEGEREKLTLQGEADRREKEIVSEADRKRKEIMGAADAEALKVLQEAYGADVEFALFLRTLDVYRTALTEGGLRVILSTDSGFLRYLNPTEKEAMGGGAK